MVRAAVFQTLLVFCGKIALDPLWKLHLDPQSAGGKVHRFLCRGKGIPLAAARAAESRKGAERLGGRLVGVTPGFTGQRRCFC